MPKRCFRAVFAGFVLGFAVLSPAQAQPARHIAALAVKDGPVVRLALSPDGKRIAYAGSDGAHILNARSGAAIADIPDIEGLIQSNGQGVMAFSPDGADLILSPQLHGPPAFLSIWNALSGAKRRDVAVLSNQQADAAMLSVAADGKSLAAAANGLGAREIRIFSLPGLLPSHVIEVPYMVLMALSADGGTIAVATALDRLTFYATASGKPAATLPLPANRWAKPLAALDYSPDGAYLAAGFANGGRVEAPGPDGTLAVVPNPFPTEPVILWHVVHGLPQGTPTKLCGRQPDGVEDLLWLPKGRGVVITDQNGSAKLCPLDGAQAQTISAGTSSAIAIPALSADGRELVIGVNGQINLYELRPDEQG